MTPNEPKPSTVYFYITPLDQHSCRVFSHALVCDPIPKPISWLLSKRPRWVDHLVLNEVRPACSFAWLYAWTLSGTLAQSNQGKFDHLTVSTPIVTHQHAGFARRNAHTAHRCLMETWRTCIRLVSLPRTRTPRWMAGHMTTSWHQKLIGALPHPAVTAVCPTHHHHHAFLTISLFPVCL